MKSLLVLLSLAFGFLLGCFLYGVFLVPKESSFTKQPTTVADNVEGLSSKPQQIDENASETQTKSQRSNLLSNSMPNNLAGSRTLTGRVTDQLGRALPNVKLTLYNRDLSMHISASQYSSIEEFAQKAISTYNNQVRLSPFATSDSDGNFSFHEIFYLPYQLRAERQGFSFEYSIGTIKNTDHHLEIIGRSQQKVKLDIRFADGKKLGYADLLVDSVHKRTWSASNPYIQLKDGEHLICASFESGGFSKPVAFTVDQNQPSKSIRIELPVHPSLNVKIKVPRELRDLRPSIHWLATAKSQEVDFEQLLLRGQSVQVPINHLTKKSYTLRNLAVGFYWVGISLASHRIEQAKLIEVVNSTEKVSFSIAQIPADISLKVRLKGDIKNRQLYPSFQLETADRKNLEIESTLSFNDHYLLIPKYDIQAYIDEQIESPLFLSMNANAIKRVVELSSREVEFLIPECSRLTVQLSGEDITLTRIELFNMSGEKIRQYSSLGNPRAGTYVFEAEVGNYNLSVKRRLQPVYQKNLYLGKGEEKITVPIPREHKLVIHADRKYKSMHIKLDAQQSGITMLGKLSDTGFSFSRLLAGNYILSTGTDFMLVKLSEDSQLSYQPTEFNAFLFTHKGAGKRDFGFDDGDLIIGLNSKEAESLKDYAEIYSRPPGKDRFTFMVQRGSRVFDLQFLFDDVHALLKSMQIQPTHTDL